MSRKSKSGKKPRVQGVLQSTIDKLRGKRGHSNIYWKDVQDDYARVGIKKSDVEAKEITHAISLFTRDGYKDMRSAAFKQARNEKLNFSEQSSLDQYKKVMEYTKIAPTFTSKNKYIYRGIKNSGSEYSKRILALNKGDTVDFDKMPSSFSTKIKTAIDFGGIIFKLPISKLKNSVSIRGLAHHSYEDEVLVGDYNLKVKNKYFSSKESSYIIELE